MVNFRRKLPDADWLEAIADLLINLSAGLFGAILIVPNFSGSEFPANLIILTVDFVGGIFNLLIAVRIRKAVKKLVKRSEK